MTNYDILPPAQKALLPELRGMRRAGYVLYGGTAIALRIGHRESIDFDFFSDKPLAERDLVAAVPTLKDGTALQREPDTWTLLVTPVGHVERPVKLSFFGGLGFGRVGTPEPTEGGELLLASTLDLLGHKLKVLLQRVEPKDYRDIAALLRAGHRLEAGLGAASALFGSSFPPAEAVRAMTYFEGGDFGSLTKEDRGTLTRAAANAGPIIPVGILSHDLTVSTPDTDGPSGRSPGMPMGNEKERPRAGLDAQRTLRRAPRPGKGRGIADD